MQFTWHADKEARNIADRGISFGFAVRIWNSDVLDMASPRAHADEARRIAFGTIDSTLYAVVYVMVESNHHIISARRASRPERRDYDKR